MKIDLSQCVCGCLSFCADPNRCVDVGIQQRMKRATVALIQAHQTQFQNRPGCFEWLGLDFVIGEKPDLEVHLLEVCAAISNVCKHLCAAGWLLLCFLIFFLWTWRTTPFAVGLHDVDQANLSPDASHETSVLTELCEEGYGDFFARVLGPVASASETAGSIGDMNGAETGGGASANTTCPPDNSATHSSRRNPSDRHQWECIYRETEREAKTRCALLDPVARDRVWYNKQTTAAARKTMDVVRAQAIELLSSTPLQRRAIVRKTSCATAAVQKPARSNESTQSPPAPRVLNSDTHAGEDDDSSSDEL